MKKKRINDGTDGITKDELNELFNYARFVCVCVKNTNVWSKVKILRCCFAVDVS